MACSVTSCVCDCLPPCEEEGQIISVVETESLEWFEYYENSIDTIFTNRLVTSRYYSNNDTTIITDKTDTISFVTTSNFVEDAQCIEGCPSICEKIDGNITGFLNNLEINPQVNLTAGALTGDSIISIELLSTRPINKSYIFSVRNTGELTGDINAFRLKKENRDVIKTRLSQEEINRVIVSQLDEFELDGTIYENCYELLDSIAFDSGSFYSLRIIINQNEGPILFEGRSSSYFPDIDKTQFDLNIIKKLK